jgi:hypothetical protein
MVNRRRYESAAIPVFVEGIAEQFFRIFKEYFEEKEQQSLFSLLTNNVSPKAKLLFNSNGNQLADAFKQLIEANLIVSCNKAELESWITVHFQYVSNAQAKSFTAGYLNGIISSDVKICKSPERLITECCVHLETYQPWPRRECLHHDDENWESF